MNYVMKSTKTSVIDSTITHIFFNYINFVLDTKLSEAADSGNLIKVILTDK